MIEIELPCCNGTSRVPDVDAELRCDACGIVVDVAPDAPLPGPARLDAIAAPVPATALAA